MCQSLKTKLEDKLTYENLLKAHYRSKQMKGNRLEVLRFELDLETNLINLYRKIKNGAYHLGKYREFIIYEPKERLIKSLPYVDRIVHQWYIEEFIKPYMYPRFISDTYACIEGRGTHKAVLKVQANMKKFYKKKQNYYILKCDIKKFFYSIDKNVLYKIFERVIRDPQLLEFTKKLIYDGTDIIGIPIGNYTSQFFANIYMNGLDHYVKEKLRIKYYVRYMDDFILLVNDKEEAKIVKGKIEEYLKENLHLELNHKSNYYPNAMGVDFCGYRIFHHYILLRTRSKQKIKKNIKKWNKQFQNDHLDLAKVRLQWNAWLAHSDHANSYHLQCRMYDKIIFKELLRDPSL